MNINETYEMFSMLAMFGFEVVGALALVVWFWSISWILSLIILAFFVAITLPMFKDEKDEKSKNIGNNNN